MEELNQLSRKQRAITPTLMFLFLSVLEFVVFYLFYLFFSQYSGYYVYFVQRTVMLTLLVAGSVTVYKTAENIGEAILHSALISVTRCVFFIPFFYLEFLSNVIYDSIDALALSIFASIVATVLHTAVTTGISFIIKAVCKKHGNIKTAIARPTDFKAAFSGTVLIISLVISMINFIVELVTAIVFVVESRGILFFSEAIYIVISLLFPILMLISIYFLSILIAIWIDKTISKKIKKAESKSADVQEN